MEYPHDCSKMLYDNTFNVLSYISKARPVTGRAFDTPTLSTQYNYIYDNISQQQHQLQIDKKSWVLVNLSDTTEQS